MPKSTSTLRRQSLRRRPGFLQALRAAKKPLPALHPGEPSDRPASPKLAAYPSFADLLPPEVLAQRQPRPDTPPPSSPPPSLPKSLLSAQLAKMALDDGPLRSSAPSPQP